MCRLMGSSVKIEHRRMQVVVSQYQSQEFKKNVVDSSRHVVMENDNI